VLEFDRGDRLRAATNRIAETTVARDYAQRPLLLDRYGESGRKKYLQDILYNLATLAAALDADDPAMFVRYVAWLKIMLVSRGVALEDVAESLRCMLFALNETAGDHSNAVACVRSAWEQLDSMPTAVASFIEGSSQEHAVAEKCLQDLLRLDAAAARETLAAAIAAGLPPARIFSGIIPPLMREIGRLWQINEISVAHEHYCSAAVQSILAGFYRRIFVATPQSDRSVLVACVESEQHEIGARTLADVFELNGWRTSFLGANLPSRDLALLIKRATRGPDLVALSATMPQNLGRLASTIAAIRDGSNVPILIGGFLFHGNPSLATQMGADGYAEDADQALVVAASALAARP
jgi:MerR family transcriptional regulator, light-induced transcriptional regulator